MLAQACAPAPPKSLSGHQFHLDRRHLATAWAHPAQCAEPGAFLPTPARCRRAIGLDAVDRCVRGRARSITDAVAMVLADAGARLTASEHGTTLPWWAGWWAALPAGAQAVVQAEAVTWGTQLWGGVDWSSLGGRVTVVTRDRRWAPPACRWVRLVGRTDLRAEGPFGCAYLVVGAGVAGCGWQHDLALPAFVAALSSELPGSCDRVVGWWPESGQVRALTIDDQVLLDFAGVIVTVVRDLVTRRSRSSHRRE